MIIVSSRPEAGTGVPAQDDHPEDQGGARDQLGSCNHACHLVTLRICPVCGIIISHRLYVKRTLTKHEPDACEKRASAVGTQGALAPYWTVLLGPSYLDQKRVPARQLRTTIPKISPAHAMNWAANCTLAIWYLRVSAGP
jgi:hypothetical protein